MTAPALAPSSRRVARRAAMMIVVWVALSALIAWSLRGVSWPLVTITIRRASAMISIAAVLANAMILVAWSLMWITFLPPEKRARWSEMFQVNALAASVMNTAPLLLGHATGVALLVRRIRLTITAALGVITLDQLYEGLAKITLFVLAATLLPLPAWMRDGVKFVGVLVAILLVILLVVARRPGLAPRPLASIARELATLRDWKPALLALAFALLMKLAEGAAILAVQRSLGIVLPLHTLPLVLSAVVLATMIPLSPGNLGPYEAAAVLAYKSLGLSTETAIGLAIWQHLLYLVPMLGCGYAKMSWDMLRGRDALADLRIVGADVAA